MQFVFFTILTWCICSIIDHFLKIYKTKLEIQLVQQRAAEKIRQEQKDADNLVLDDHMCDECGGVLRRKITFQNVTCQSPMLFCPFCGAEYPEESEVENG